jgi:hypothetical protein
VKTNLERYQMMMMNLRMMLFRENLWAHWRLVIVLQLMNRNPQF